MKLFIPPSSVFQPLNPTRSHHLQNMVYLLRDSCTITEGLPIKEFLIYLKIFIFVFLRVCRGEETDWNERPTKVDEDNEISTGLRFLGYKGIG